MDKIIKLVVLAVLLFVAFDRGLPWIQRNLADRADAIGDVASGAATHGAASTCVSAADRASNAFGASIGRLGGPDGDLDSWSDFMDRVESKINQAEDRCECDVSSCEKASQAMSALAGVLRDFDDQKRGSGGLGSDPVRRQERINDLLDEARRLARQGD